ncbi:ABC-F family ATP-binding cassette domain-containing protein [Lawsonella clevelandensis]|uniref:Energy-dependent translational throttle protein EttA n=1 Tax=Lawsonella clevelandensis TaxID=1528099 RepID=A0A5E3ZW77_9ACTN|nr:ABC-F family ATP-binding cassette domain-containing protein [Lawsonella clevelandensis]ALE34355.1 glycerophosphodiester phosphodiesterase [Lawsonella clevelandensis]VHO00030.1 Energy-dependent translational throttle protein EttA [Lawsonella clevelandensis]
MPTVPLNLINCEDVSLSYGLKSLLDHVSLGISETDRIGIVGLNGGGKTTLLEVLTGLQQPDSGRVSRRSDLRFAVVTQRSPLPPGATVGESILAGMGLDSYEWASDARIRSTMAGLGIGNLGLNTSVDNLSGGEKRRVALAAALVQELDLIILDEPTNHLDVEGVQWLADHLLSRRCAVVVVTHDRWFLDTIATRTWEVHDGQVDMYDGGYNDWVFARAERARQAAAAEQRRQNLMRKELAWLRRGAPARTSKPRYRIEAAEALIADVPEPRNSAELLKFSSKRLGKTVIDFFDGQLVSVAGDVLIEHLNWMLAPGERIGLVGVNGSGKTTLLRALAGDYPLAGGKRVQGPTVHIGWLKQELDDLPTDRTVLQAVEDVAGRVTIGKNELTASQLLERLGFRPARHRTPVKDLSGGERRRLQLTRILMDEPNVLLLDEPTNDLDIDTLQQLEDLLDQWAGTLVVVSHDRYLIERICDSTWALFGDEKLTNLPRGIEQYLETRAALAKDATHQQAAQLGAEAADASTAQTAQLTAGGLVRGSAEERVVKKELVRLERTLQKLRNNEKTLHDKLAAAASATPVDTQHLAELDRTLKAVLEEISEVEIEWLEKAETLE